MRYENLGQFLKDGEAAPVKGPLALIFVEDLVEVEPTIRHHLSLQFEQVIVFAPPGMGLPMDLAETVIRVDFAALEPGAVQRAVNSVIRAWPDIWLYYCYNAEFLFYPFCEHRSVAELLAFHAEERRSAMLTYVVDLYAGDLSNYPDAVSISDAMLDRSGYYALARHDEHGNARERQLDFFGGLRWRYEEHIAPEKRKIDRIALFKSAPGLVLRDNHTFSEPEYNTYACPWHNNLTATICSFRTAKALKSNAGSTFDIETFRWHNSVPFEWHSQQLLDLGLMEPGQWF